MDKVQKSKCMVYNSLIAQWKWIYMKYSFVINEARLGLNEFNVLSTT